MQEIFLKIRFFNRGFSKSPRKVKFIFLSNPALFNGQNYQKQKRAGTSNQLLFRLQSKFRKILLLVMFYLITFDDAM